MNLKIEVEMKKYIELRKVFLKKWYKVLNVKVKLNVEIMLFEFK